nr:DNA packaging terminase subunit 2 UL28 [Psittacid alphaherpesvirus 6]
MDFRDNTPDKFRVGVVGGGARSSYTHDRRDVRIFPHPPHRSYIQRVLRNTGSRSPAESALRYQRHQPHSSKSQHATPVRQDDTRHDRTRGVIHGNPILSATVSDAVARGRQKLLAIWGQVQSYIFQVELLKRCDPLIGIRYLRALKANALTVRYLMDQLRGGVDLQRRNRLTTLTCSMWLALVRAAGEGENLIETLCRFERDRNARAFFASTMGLEEGCRYHTDYELETYGGSVRTDIRFLHDIENVLKQLNYCHLIVSAKDALRFLTTIEMYLLQTVASGGVVPQELYDPSHPCSVCFEELCVTANRGESATKRVAGKICDHVTKQVRVRVGHDEIIGYLPHAVHIEKAKRDAACAALERVDAIIEDGKKREKRGRNNGPGENSSTSDDFESMRDAADAALDAHNVFVPASCSLYAVSELKFWLASSGEQTPTTTRGRTVDAFTGNLESLETRERDFDLKAAVVEIAIFGRRMDHFERVYAPEMERLATIDRLLLGGKSSSPDDAIEALIKACYDHHLSAPLLRRLADPEKAAEDALRKALANIAAGRPSDAGPQGFRDPTGSCSSSPYRHQYTARQAMGGSNRYSTMSEEVCTWRCMDDDVTGNNLGVHDIDDSGDDPDERLRFEMECLRPQYRGGCPPSRTPVKDPSVLRPLTLLESPILGSNTTSSSNTEARRDSLCGDAGAWADLAAAAISDVNKRRKMYAERLTKRSMAALDRCVTEQRLELEKTLRVNVYGEILIDSFVAVFNGFSSRALMLEKVKTGWSATGSRILDNRQCNEAFDAHRFMMSTLLRRRVDPAMLPSLTHKFFQLVNGPLFDHDRHTFAQPPNTALYFSVENVGLLPHLKEELARFMTSGCGTSFSDSMSKGGKGGPTGTDWTISRFRGFYDFNGVEGVTAAQRLAWKYIKELILASALFSSVFRCGEIRILRADSVATDDDGEKVWKDGIYLTYERECPLVAVIGTNAKGRLTESSTVILDSDVFSLLYSMLQKMAPGAVEKARNEERRQREGASTTSEGVLGGVETVTSTS